MEDYSHDAKYLEEYFLQPYKQKMYFSSANVNVAILQRAHKVRSNT